LAYSTTAQALSWLFYELLENPQELTRVREEVLDVVGEETMPDYAAVKRMPYLSAAFFEALRLHPSVPKDVKMAINDDVLPSSGHRIRGGTWLAYCPYVMGRLPQIWGEDCRQFKPQRFVEDPNPSAFKYTAFQAGPRICLGRNMAELEATIVAAVMLQRYSFRLMPNHPRVTYANSLTLQMATGLWVIPEKRTPLHH
jgi:fatty acid omega-hydroxylase